MGGPSDRLPQAQHMSIDVKQEIQASKEASQSTLTRIIKMVEDAEERRAPSERFVQKFARGYTPAVTALALSAAVTFAALRAPADEHADR